MLSAVAYPVLLGIVGVMILMVALHGRGPASATCSTPCLAAPRCAPVPHQGGVLRWATCSGGLVVVVPMFGDPHAGYGLSIAGFARRRGAERWDSDSAQDAGVRAYLTRLVAVSGSAGRSPPCSISGVPIISALSDRRSDVVGNVVIAEAVSKASHSITEGQSVAKPVEALR